MRCLHLTGTDTGHFSFSSVCGYTFWLLMQAVKAHLMPPPALSDPAEAPVLCQPQLPSHGGQSDRGGVQPNAHR